MTEREYIDATNLSKIRSARRILADMLPMGAIDQLDMDAAMLAISKWEDRLTDAVKVKTR